MKVGEGNYLVTKRISEKSQRRPHGWQEDGETYSINSEKFGKVDN
jgi:hypothetical protein